MSAIMDLVEIWVVMNEEKRIKAFSSDSFRVVSSEQVHNVTSRNIMKKYLFLIFRKIM